MKTKSNKRSLSNKHRRSQPRRLSVSTDPIRSISPNRIDFGKGPVHIEGEGTCLRPRELFKNPKLLKKDLLRCSNQRPSLLGVQTLQPPRLHQSQPNGGSHSLPSSSIDRTAQTRHRSLSSHSSSFYATIDRVGPWPDVSISRIRSDGNELLRPLKTFRNVKNPRVFSPKYYAALTDNTSRFKFYPSTKNYMEEYRKQKGYLLAPQSLGTLSVSSSILIPQSDEDQLSTGGTFTGTMGDATVRDRSDVLTSDFSQIRSSPNEWTENVFPVIGTSLPPVSSRLPPTKPSRSNPPVAQQTISLPSLTKSSLTYLNSIQSVEKTYGQTKTKMSRPTNPSKVFLLDGRQKKRNSHRIHSDGEITSRSHDYAGSGTPPGSVEERLNPIIVYQIARRTEYPLSTQSDVGSFS